MREGRRTTKFQPGHPATLGAPFLNVSTRPRSASQAKSPGKASPEKNRREPVVLGRIAYTAQLGGATGRPFQADERQAAQDEKKRKRHDEGRQARPDHDDPVDRADKGREQESQRMATTKGKPQVITQTPKNSRRRPPWTRSTGRTRRRSSASPRRWRECQVVRRVSESS